MTGFCWGEGGGQSHYNVEIYLWVGMYMFDLAQFLEMFQN